MRTIAITFKSLYLRGKISIGAVLQAVKDGVLTEEEYVFITDQAFPEN